MTEVRMAGALKDKHLRGRVGQVHVRGGPRSGNEQGVCRTVSGPDRIESSIPAGSGSGFHTLTALIARLGSLNFIL